MPADDAPEFSRPVLVDRIPAKGLEMDVSAKPAERAALAERFGLVELSLLEARLRLKPMNGGTVIRLEGSFRADVVQSCVVTLDPIPATVEDEFVMSFSTEDETIDGDEIELSLDAEDPPDPIEGGAIDVGEAVAEHLSLALDPFPRKAGAAFDGGVDDAPPVDEKPNPFAVLAQLRQKKD